MKNENQTINKIPFENLGNLVEESFKLYAKTILTNGMFLLLLSVIGAILIGVGVSYFIDPELLLEKMKNFKPENITIDQALIFTGISVVINILIVPFVGGMLKVNQEADETGICNFSTIFSLVNSPAYLQLVLGIMTTTLISSLINHLPLFLGIKGSFQIVTTLLVYIFSFLTVLTIPLIALKKYSFIEAFIASIKGVSQNIFLVLVMIILAIIIACLGIFAFCVGIFFTMPILYTVQYVLCKRIFNEDTELKS